MGSADDCDDCVNIVVKLSLLCWLLGFLGYKFVFLTEFCAMSDKIGLFALSRVVRRCLFILAEDLDSRGALDAELFGQITIRHDIDCAELDLFVLEGRIFDGLSKIVAKGLAVGAPVRIEGDDPGVFLILADELFPVV